MVKDGMPSLLMPNGGQKVYDYYTQKYKSNTRSRQCSMLSCQIMDSGTPNNWRVSQIVRNKLEYTQELNIDME